MKPITKKQLKSISRWYSSLPYDLGERLFEGREVADKRQITRWQLRVRLWCTTTAFDSHRRCQTCHRGTRDHTDNNKCLFAVGVWSWPNASDIAG